MSEYFIGMSTHDLCFRMHLFLWYLGMPLFDVNNSNRICITIRFTGNFFVLEIRKSFFYILIQCQQIFFLNI